LRPRDRRVVPAHHVSPLGIRTKATLLEHTFERSRPIPVTTVLLEFWLVPDFVPARALGTELRALFERMDADVGRALGDLGLAGYRPRFSPVVRVLAEGPA